MSYGAVINFKTVKATEVYPFFQELKRKAREKMKEIAEDEFLYMPSIRYEHRNVGLDVSTINEIDRKWAQTAVFTYRFFYLPEHELLGVFGVPNAVKEIFDTSIYFQNSCNQDYSFDEWKGVPAFERIANKWEKATAKETEEYYSKRYGSGWDEDCDCDYFRRSFAYDEIWNMCEHYLYSEDDVVFISMFALYESYVMSAFVNCCREGYKRWQAEVALKEKE